MSEQLPELMPGQSGQAHNGSVNIAYEVIGNTSNSKGYILLTCGHTQSLLDWPKHFINFWCKKGIKLFGLTIFIF